MPVPAIFYAHGYKSPLKSTNQVGRFHHVTLQNGGHEGEKWPGRSLGMKLKCQIAAIGVKNRPVCPHQSMVKFARDFCWRSNSLQSAYKIARCGAGFSELDVSEMTRRRNDCNSMGVLMINFKLHNQVTDNLLTDFDSLHFILDSFL